MWLQTCSESLDPFQSAKRLAYHKKPLLPQSETWRRGIQVFLTCTDRLAKNFHSERFAAVFRSLNICLLIILWLSWSGVPLCVHQQVFTLSVWECVGKGVCVWYSMLLCFVQPDTYYIATHWENPLRAADMIHEHATYTCVEERPVIPQCWPKFYHRWNKSEASTSAEEQIHEWQGP